MSRAHDIYFVDDVIDLVFQCGLFVTSFSLNSNDVIIVYSILSNRYSFKAYYILRVFIKGDHVQNIVTLENRFFLILSCPASAGL